MRRVGAPAFPSLWLGSLLAACLLVTAAAAQEPPALPSVPSGPATIRGEVHHPEGAARVAGLPVVLYALASDGTPGVDNTTTDAAGAFAFEGVSNDPGTVFLLAVRYGEIPFGRRLAFAPEQLEQTVVVDVSDPVHEATDLRVTETRFTLDLTAGGVVVREVHGLEVAEGPVAYVPAEARAGATPLFTARLPAGATDFRPVMMNVGDDLEQRGRDLLYWGPIYPEGQEVQYEYRLPAVSGALTLREVLPSGSERVLVAVPPGVSLASTTRLRERDATEPQGPSPSFQVWEGTGFAPGERLEVRFELPELRSDPGAIALDEATHWLELDDTNLLVNSNLALSVSPGAPVVADGDDPLLRLVLPPGAELLGVSEEFEALGAERTDTGFDLRGPIGPGDTRLAYRYRVPSDAGRASVDLTFDRDVPVVRALIADTGVVVESERTHRRRPVRQGTRTYLHREAFQVAAGEPVHLGLSLIERSPTPRAVSLGLMVVVALASGWMLAAPLRGSPDGAADESEASALEHERSLVYTSIRDLDHDYETGKIADEDYAQARTALRARAVELLRQEQVAEADSVAAAAPAEGAVRFCTGCGERLQPQWRFCSACGEAIAAAESERESAG